MQGGCNEQIMAPIVYQGKVIFISSHKSPKEKKTIPGKWSYRRLLKPVKPSKTTPKQSSIYN